MVVLLSLPNLIVSVYTINGHVATCSAPTEFAALFVMIDAVQIVGSFSMRAYKNNLPIYRFDGGVLVDCPPSWLLLRHHEFRQRVGRCSGFG